MIHVAEPVLMGNERRYVLDALDRRQLSAGSYVARFERAFAELAGCEYALATTSGTTALHLALLALNIGIGDEVILPALTFVATANAVRYCGAVPVLADVDADTWQIDVDDVASRITSRTRAIIAVHLYGHPADMDGLRELSDGYELHMIEDAAEAPGALYRGKPVGSMSDVAAFSFYGNKIITTGEGGMLTTNNKRIYERALLLRGQAQDPQRRYWHTEVGYNYRMGELQGAVGLGQVEQFAAHLEARVRVARQYRLYRDGPWCWQDVAPWADPACWINVALLHEDIDRDAAADRLAYRGIETRPTFWPLHWLPPYRDCGQCGDYPMAEQIAQQGLCLPSHGRLSNDQIGAICGALLSACQEAS